MAAEKPVEVRIKEIIVEQLGDGENSLLGQNGAFSIG